MKFCSGFMLLQFLIASTVAVIAIAYAVCTISMYTSAIKEVEEEKKRFLRMYWLLGTAVDWYIGYHAICYLELDSVCCSVPKK